MWYEHELCIYGPTVHRKVWLIEKSSGCLSCGRVVGRMMRLCTKCSIIHAHICQIPHSCAVKLPTSSIYCAASLPVQPGSCAQAKAAWLNEQARQQGSLKSTTNAGHPNMPSMGELPLADPDAKQGFAKKAKWRVSNQALHIQQGSGRAT